MDIANILSRLAGEDLEPTDQLIPISFMFILEVVGHCNCIMQTNIRHQYLTLPKQLHQKHASQTYSTI